MKNKEILFEDLAAVAQNCSQFSPVASLQSSADCTCGCSCSICKKWDGKKCSIGIYDVIASDLGLAYRK